MKNKFIIVTLVFLCFAQMTAKSRYFLINDYISTSVSEYETSVTFPAGYAIGDYVEFLRVNPIDAGASGYYQISISYTRGYIASAATHLAAISHANPDLWRETGRINNNPYAGSRINFTIDCNTQYGNPRFRIRAINSFGVTSDALTVNIKVTSLNLNSSFLAMDTRGNDVTVSKFLPMTSDWDLYVGDIFSSNGASLAIKALQNGNVGIGTGAPDEKLTVKGKIHTQEVRVDMVGPLVPDYVFARDYKLKTLQEVEEYINKNKHLPEIPSAKDIEKKGLMLAEMNMSLLKKIEELTLYLIEVKKENETMKKNQQQLEKRIKTVENK